MTVSILIPTRERLHYLRLAVESVRRQSSPDWEIVIADNASTEDIAGYVASLDDPRVVYVRSDDPLPVTANWNAAIDASTGDMVIMLGDDDALMPGYLDVIAEHAGHADLVYSGAHKFVYPDVEPEHPRGYAQHYGYAEFLRDATGPRPVTHDTALELVRDAVGFRLRFGFNMQFATLSRRLVDALRVYGPVFQSPFPDYYAMCAALLEAETVVGDPRPLVAIGVTPKSYGFYHANRREDEGMTFLDPSLRDAVPSRLAAELLPGTKINTGWLLAMDVLCANLGARHGLELDVERYRFVQATTVLRDRYLLKADNARDLAALRRHLRPAEQLRYGLIAAAMRVSAAIPPAASTALVDPIRRRLGQFPEWSPPRLEGRYADILELFEALRDAPPAELSATAPAP
jgi:hypothetical protein